MMTVPPDAGAGFAAYVLQNRLISEAALADGASAEAGADAGSLAAGADGAAADGAVVEVVPPQAATKMAAPANRPNSFRIKAPPSCAVS
jgi:hypothetical protein